MSRPPTQRSANQTGARNIMATRVSDMPSFNSPTWKGKIQCLGVDNDSAGGTRFGCGAGFDISRADLCLVSRDGIFESSHQVFFRCPDCGVETEHPHSRHFKDLPTRGVWLAAHTDPIIEPNLARVMKNEE